MASGFTFRKSESGGTVELKQITMNEAGKQGDVIVSDGDTASQAQAALMDDTAESPLGVLIADAEADETGQFIPWKRDYVFEVACSSDEKYVDASDRYTTCDIDTYTSGAMGIDPATDTNHHVQILGLAEGESDDTNGNKVLVRPNVAVSQYL